MVTYNRYPAMDAANNFPPTVREALASSPEHMSVTKALVFSEVPKQLAAEPVLTGAAQVAVDEAIRDRHVPVILRENYLYAQPLLADRYTRALWRFNNDLKDSGPNGYTLTKVANSPDPTYSTSDPKFGTHSLNVGTFKGFAAPAELDDHLAPEIAVALTQDVTIEGWCKTTASGAIQVIAGRGRAYWIGMHTEGTVYAGYNLNDNGTTQYLGGGLGSPVINDGKWHHVALVIKKSMGSLYCDGKLVLSSSNIAKPVSYANTKFSIGTLVPNLNFLWQGQLDEIRYSFVARDFDGGIQYEPRPNVPGGFVTYLGATTPTGMVKGDSWRKVGLV